MVSISQMECNFFSIYFWAWDWRARDKGRNQQETTNKNKIDVYLEVLKNASSSLKVSTGHFHSLKEKKMLKWQQKSGHSWPALILQLFLSLFFKSNWPQASSFHLVNPLSPDIKMHILLTVLHTFLMELVRRICLNIKTPHPWWSIPLFSSLEWLNK